MMKGVDCNEPSQGEICIVQTIGSTTEQWSVVSSISFASATERSPCPKIQLSLESPHPMTNPTVGSKGQLSALAHNGTMLT
jgi:hypothetical protein